MEDCLVGAPGAEHIWKLCRPIEIVPCGAENENKLHPDIVV